MRYILYLCWKTFIKGGYWLYFGVSLMVGVPFIHLLSMVFDFPFKTGSFHYKSVIILMAFWFFLLQISELVNMKINKRLYNYWNVFWGLVGFNIALFIMR
jgi:hypothetical protein